MRIENENEYDVLWFAEDDAGRVLAARSRGRPLPEFVKADAGLAMLLAEKLFCPAAIRRMGREPFDTDKLTSLYGFYCYEAEDGDGAVYRLAAAPASPADAGRYTEDVRELLENNRAPFDAARTPRFQVVDGLLRPLAPPAADPS
jgi:hypothetical protein